LCTNDRRRGGAINQDKPGSTHSVTDIVWGVYKLPIILGNYSHWSFPMAIFMFSIQKSTKENTSHLEARNKSKSVVQCQRLHPKVEGSVHSLIWRSILAFNERC
jgi:hypothetical protein